MTAVEIVYHSTPDMEFTTLKAGSHISYSLTDVLIMLFLKNTKESRPPTTGRVLMMKIIAPEDQIEGYPSDGVRRGTTLVDMGFESLSVDEALGMAHPFVRDVFKVETRCFDLTHFVKDSDSDDILRIASDVMALSDKPSSPLVVSHMKSGGTIDGNNTFVHNWDSGEGVR